MKGIMIQGTSSDVGKSFITAALCRLFINEGIKVAPFKSQNMTNNSYMTVDGKEIGRSQGMQAEAAKLVANEMMNPILLKPRADFQVEVVLKGESVEILPGINFREKFYEKGIEVIQSSLADMKAKYEIVVIEGAGSPVEINLKERDLANMKVAELANVPVILVADIERGGVFANIVGTLVLLTPEEKRRVQGLIINKFHGNSELFQSGVEWLEENTGIPILGVIPFMTNRQMDREQKKPTEELKDERYDELALEMKKHLNWEKIKQIVYEWE